MPIVQINIKIDKRDLKLIDEKARRTGLSRSSLMKTLALNAEPSYELQGKMRTPRAQGIKGKPFEDFLRLFRCGVPDIK